MWWVVSATGRHHPSDTRGRATRAPSSPPDPPTCPGDGAVSRRDVPLQAHFRPRQAFRVPARRALISRLARVRTTVGGGVTWGPGRVSGARKYRTESRSCRPSSMRHARKGGSSTWSVPIRLETRGWRVGPEALGRVRHGARAECRGRGSLSRCGVRRRAARGRGSPSSSGAARLCAANQNSPRGPDRIRRQYRTAHAADHASPKDEYPHRSNYLLAAGLAPERLGPPQRL